MAKKQSTGAGESATVPTSDSNGDASVGPHDATQQVDLRLLLTALKRLKKGDFGVRLPMDETVLGAATADAFNEVAELLENSTREFARIGSVVGKEGRISQRASLGGATGSWAAWVHSVNTLIGDLVQPTEEVARVIGAVAKGDLSKSMALEAEGRALEGHRRTQPMPFGRSKKAIKEICAKDPATAYVTSVGSDDANFELHVAVENHGTCKITELTGTAYGFDARGKPSPLGKDGLQHTTFEAKDQSIAPGEKANVSKKLEGAELATLAIAHIDSTKCADGTSWARK